MTDRTEEQKITRAPIMVILGGKQYEIAPLVIRDSLVWKRKVAQAVVPFPQLVGITMDEPEKFSKALNYLLVDASEQVIDLFFDYARGLNREEIEGIATETEVAMAFQEVVKVAFGPLAESLPKIMAKLSRSEAPLNS